MAYSKELHANAERVYDILNADRSFFSFFTTGTTVKKILNGRDKDLERRLKSAGVSLRLTEAVRDELNTIAKKEGVSVSFIIDDCLTRFIRDYNHWDYNEKENKYIWLERFDSMSEEEQKKYLSEKEQEYLKKIEEKEEQNKDLVIHTKDGDSFFISKKDMPELYEQLKDKDLSKLTLELRNE